MSIPHGSYSGYRHHRCRCPDCTDANRRTQFVLRAERCLITEANGGVAPVAQHNRHTYRNWGCKCPECRADNARRSAENRRRYGVGS